MSNTIPLSLLPPPKTPPTIQKDKTTPIKKPPLIIKLKPLPRSNDLYKHLITQTNKGQTREIITTLKTITHQGLTPDLTTLSLILKKSIHSRTFHLGKLVHFTLTQSFPPNEITPRVYNQLMALYGQIGEVNKVNEIFLNMESKRNYASWVNLVSIFGEKGLIFETIRAFVDMLRLGYTPNEICLKGVIKACSHVGWSWFGEIVNGYVIKCGYVENLHVGYGLICMYVEVLKDFGSARKVFDKLPRKSLGVWAYMMSRYTKFGFAKKAVELFLEMEREGVVPDHFVFACVISACCRLGLVELGKQLHCRVLRSGFAADDGVGCALVEMYSKWDFRDVESPRKVFEMIGKKNVMCWTSIITLYVQSEGCQREALGLYRDMVSESVVVPDHIVLTSVLKACADLSDLGFGEQVQGHAVKLGYSSDNGVGNVLVIMYMNLGMMREAEKAFDVILDKDVVSWSVMLNGYGRYLDLAAAFKVFHQMDNVYMCVNAGMFNNLLKTIGCVGAGEKGEQIHGLIVKTRLQSNKFLCNALAIMYSRCGNIRAAYKVFSNSEKNVVTWTTMIRSFGENGFAGKALDIFNQMIRTGVRPHESTFTAVLLACSQAGMLSEGRRYFSSMSTEYGIVPIMEHYAYMVHLLGRSGFLHEAMELINSMPFEANSLVWKALLCACLVHGNMELGELAAKALLEQEPDNSTSYTLACNLYASNGQWEHVEKIRTEMKNKNLQKEAACSWIETDSSVHRFFVGETSHSRATEIHRRLDDLISEMREMGYVPKIDIILHDIEEEQREESLLQHSEKIAVAYGLISTPRSKPIRIFKNLRLCADCHTAMKYISKATSREIIVRDINRFHYFTDGSCSCSDYLL